MNHLYKKFFFFFVLILVSASCTLTNEVASQENMSMSPSSRVWRALILKADVEFPEDTYDTLASINNPELSKKYVDILLYYQMTGSTLEIGGKTFGLGEFSYPFKEGASEESCLRAVNSLKERIASVCKENEDFILVDSAWLSSKSSIRDCLRSPYWEKKTKDLSVKFFGRFDIAHSASYKEMLDNLYEKGCYLRWHQIGGEREMMFTGAIWPSVEMTKRDFRDLVESEFDKMKFNDMLFYVRRRDQAYLKDEPLADADDAMWHEKESDGGCNKVWRVVVVQPDVTSCDLLENLAPLEGSKVFEKNNKILLKTVSTGQTLEIQGKKIAVSSIEYIFKEGESEENCLRVVDVVSTMLEYVCKENVDMTHIDSYWVRDIDVRTHGRRDEGVSRDEKRVKNMSISCVGIMDIAHRESYKQLIKNLRKNGCDGEWDYKRSTEQSLMFRGEFWPVFEMTKDEFYEMVKSEHEKMDFHDVTIFRPW